jgi:hypothetical protein
MDGAAWCFRERPRPAEVLVCEGRKTTKRRLNISGSIKPLKSPGTTVRALVWNVRAAESVYRRPALCLGAVTGHGGNMPARSLIPTSFDVTPITDGASHFRRRCLLSMTLFWFPLKVAPKKL